ncbi:MAG: recombination protein RecR [Parcubacteria group bacterium Greene0714_21]|nr:MAG: recombination protein RecR [Parcubacteria group bacterium Greene0416_39]TSC97394.1 MAG: recombination protein RecR [Parcubacteria group bacterium Greene1014_47]TSD03857.1 MAG: recombination protein RecR [Parcubacteria group bacterium Greene0714_21]
MYPKPIQQLLELFAQFPTIGPRTAGRMVFYLLKSKGNSFDEFVGALKDLREQVKLCAFCFNPFAKENGEATLCAICADTRRDHSLLCVVEKEEDLATLEQTKTFQGLYFILGGTVGNLRKEDLQNLRTEELKGRIEHPETFGIQASFQEIILALNPTTEGEATTLYLQRFLEPLHIKTTRLGRGLPIGGEVEYADEETLRQALEGRK